jgi:toxin ParE1/3/4
MIWKVGYAESARQDLRDIREYIADILLEPVVAAKQIRRIMDAADSLDHMPLRHRLYDKDPWCSRGLRVMPVDNYVVLYLSEESRHIVTIIRIIYGGRDIGKHLN